MTDRERTPAFVQKKTQDDIIALYGLNRRARTPFSLPVAPSISTAGGNDGGISVGRQPDPEIRPWIEHGIIGSVTETIDLSIAGGNFHRIIMSGDIGIAFTNPPKFGFLQRFIIQFEQDGTGGHDVTSWPAALSNPPTIGTAIGARTRVEFYTFDGGIVYHVLNEPGSGGSGASFPLRPTVTEISSPTSTQDLDLNTVSGHVFRITADKDFTLTLSNPPADLTQHTFEVELTNDSTSVSRTVTLPSSVRQLSSITVPASDPVSRGVYVFRVNDGTNYDLVEIIAGDEWEWRRN